MSFTRRRFLAGGAQVVGLSTALGSAGIYELVDVLSGRRVREAVAASFPPEQHLLQGVATINVDATGNVAAGGAIAVPVVVPPLHSQVVTATLDVGADPASLQAAQQQLEQTIAGLEARFDPTPSGLGIAVAWGLPYFSAYVPVLDQASGSFAAGTAYPDYLPVDNRASAAAGATVRAVIDAIQFPSDSPPAGFPGGSSIRLEANHVAVLLRSDSLSNIAAGASAIFGTGPGQAGALFTVTSVRKGFAGGGFQHSTSLPKQMAMSAGLPGAQSIPNNAELFMGFTSTQAGALGPGVIANLEAIPGLTDQWPGGYFAHGTTMHLSHLFLDLAGWYGLQALSRQGRAFNAGLNLPPGTEVVDEGPSQVRNLSQVQADLQHYGLIGHSESLQPATRLAAPLTDNYGNSYVAGTAIPERADFDSLDNPFYYSADSVGDGYSSSPAASLHFVVFAPTSDAFHRGRLAMDGRYPDGTVLPLDTRTQAGFNQFLHTTHRQNFLVPPRVHRSFPLAELL
jgi:hypothetical protein